MKRFVFSLGPVLTVVGPLFWFVDWTDQQNATYYGGAVLFCSVCRENQNVTHVLKHVTCTVSWVGRSWRFLPFGRQQHARKIRDSTAVLPRQRKRRCCSVRVFNTTTDGGWCRRAVQVLVSERRQRAKAQMCSFEWFTQDAFCAA